MTRHSSVAQRLPALLALLFATLVVGCDTSNDTLTKPSLTVLRIEGEPFYLNVPTTLRGTAVFADTDANVTRLDLVVTGPDNIPTPVELPIQGAAGLKDGTFTFSLDVTFVLAGRFNVAGTIVDAKGQRSNPLTTSFDVEAGDDAPKLTALATNLPDETPVGLPLEASGTFDFLAVNGDVAAIHVDVERNGTVVHTATISPPSADVAGKKTGTLAFDLSFTPELTGSHVLVVTAEDTDGDRSNELRESFDVKSSTTAPGVVNLDLGNPRVYVDIPASIPVSFEVRDSDANAVAAIIQVLRPDNSVLQERTLDLTPGTTSTPVSTTLDINAATAGRYTVSVRARDADEQLSSATSLTFDVTTPSTTTPRIFGLRLDERPVYRNTATTITGTVDFQDVDRNLKTLDIRIVRPGQTPVTVATATIVDDTAMGNDSGTIAFSVPLTADTIAWHTLFVSARDDEGQESSELSAGFAVAASPTAPVGRNVRVTPSRLWVGIPTTVQVALDFTDSDANLVALHTVIRSPAGAAILTTRTELAGVLGRTAGNIGVTLAPTAEATGDHRLEWWLEDAAGETSVLASEPLDARAPSSTAPTLSGLDTTIPTVQTDIPARISGTIDYNDIDQNITTLRVIVRRFAGYVVVQQLDVQVNPTAASGETAFAIDFTATTSDTHELALQAVDADGQVSAFTTRTFPVVRAPNAPVITNLTVGVPRLYVDISTVIPVTLAFTDADRNVARVHARVFSPSGSLDAEHVLPATGAGGLYEGSFPLDVPFTPASTGRYRLDLRLEDGDGLRSAETSRTIDAVVPSSTAPNILDVAIDSSSAIAGRAGTVTGTASFTDIDANAANLMMRIRGANNTIIASGQVNLATLPNRARGTVSFGLDWTPPAVGFYTFDVFVRDAETQDSRVLAFGLNAATSPTAPVLSNLSLGTSRGIVDVASTIAGTVAFTDSNGNMVSLVVELTDASGRVVTTMTDDVTEVGNATSGSLPFTVGFTPVTTGRYTATAWAIDGAGELSNRVTRTFDVIRTSTTPSISDLRITVGTVFPRAEASAEGSLRFADIDGNVTRLLVRILRPDGTTLVDRQFAQTDAGTGGVLAFTLPFSADMPGRHTLEAWVEDAAGQASTREARTFDVTDTRPAATRFVALYSSLFPTKASTVTAVIDFRDLDANLTSLQLRLLRPDGTAFWTTDEALEGVEGLVSGQVSRAIAFTPDVPGRHTLEGWLVDAEGQSSTRFSTHVDVGDLANVYSACAALEVDCTGEGLCYDIKDNTCDYFEERLLTPPDACETIATTQTVAQCVSSTTDPQSPLLTETNRCSMVQYWSWPTSFPIDCRCPEAALDNRCRRPYEIPQNVTFGSGPRIRGLASTMRAWNGLVEGREFFVPIMWSTAQRPNETMIFAVNLDTGARRHFSGAWEGPNGYAQVGSGDAFVQVMDIKKGPDGQFYAVGATSDIAAPKIWRINPANGNRTKIFDADTVPEASLCPNFSTLPGRKVVQLTPEGWAMDSQGRFYFSNIGMPGPSVLRITVSGQTTSCEYVTRVMDCPTCSTQDDVGGGYGSIQFDMRAFDIVGDKLYTVSDNRFLEIDIPTGNRRLVSLGSDIGAYGTGPINAEAFGDRWTRWDPYREVFWTVGVLGGSWAVTVMPETGNRNTWPCFHDTRGVLSFCGGTGMGLTRGPLNFGGFVIDPLPPHDLYFAHDIFAIVKYDAKTGNAYNFSL